MYSAAKDEIGESAFGSDFGPSRFLHEKGGAMISRRMHAFKLHPFCAVAVYSIFYQFGFYSLLSRNAKRNYFYYADILM